MTAFIDTAHCTSGANCEWCRNREDGRAWRRLMGTKHELPAAAQDDATEDFACPRERGGRAWGWRKGDAVQITVSEKSPAVPREKWPHRVKLVASRRREGERGVGDTLARMIGKAGGDKLAKLFTRVTGRDCGCGDRKSVLNREYPY